MDTTPESGDGAGRTATSHAARNAFIGKQVVQSLGSPAGFFGVQVRPVGDDHFRVNVLVKDPPGLARIANSFFLTADASGKVMNSSPKIVRVY